MHTATGICGALAAILLAGCARVPQSTIYDVTPTDVLRNVKCELRSAYQANADLAGDWLSALQISLKVFQTGDAGGNANLVIPLNPGAFSVGLSSRISGFSAKTERIYFNESLPRLNDPVYETICDDALYFKGKQIMLIGEIGFAPLFQRIRQSVTATNTQITQLDYNLSFEVSLTGSGAATISALPVGGDGIFGASLSAGGEKAASHAMQVTFYPPLRQICPVDFVNGVCPQLVYQVNEKTVRTVRGQRSGQRTVTPTPAARTQAPSQQDLNRALDRNTTSTIIDNLRDQGIAN